MIAIDGGIKITVVEIRGHQNPTGNEPPKKSGSCGRSWSCAACEGDGRDGGVGDGWKEVRGSRKGMPAARCGLLRARSARQHFGMKNGELAIAGRLRYPKSSVFYARMATSNAAGIVPLATGDQNEIAGTVLGMVHLVCLWSMPRITCRMFAIRGSGGHWTLGGASVGRFPAVRIDYVHHRLIPRQCLPTIDRSRALRHLQNYAGAYRPIRYLPGVHAKVYVSDDDIAIVSSGNLTAGGCTAILIRSRASFGRNCRQDQRRPARLRGTWG